MPTEAAREAAEQCPGGPDEAHLAHLDVNGECPLAEELGLPPWVPGTP